MYRHLFSVLILISFFTCTLYAQIDSTKIDTSKKENSFIVQNAPKTLPIQNIDSITPKQLRPLDSLEKIIWIQNFNKSFGFPIFRLNEVIAQNQLSTQELNYQAGNKILKGQLWLPLFLLTIITLFAIYKNIFRKRLELIIQSFYSNKSLTNLNKEDVISASWSFIALFILLSLIIGFYIFQINTTYSLNKEIGTKSFFYTTGLIVLFFILKILLTSIIGIIFQVKQMTKQYITILYVTFFNIALVLLPFTAILTLTNPNISQFSTKISFIILLLIIIVQAFRSITTILSQYKFSKFYFILYFCAFEICPVLLLIKAIAHNY